MGFKLKAGVVFGAIVVAFMLLNGFAGLYRNPSLAWIFPVGAIAITVGVLIWALRHTAREGKRYGGQILTALVVCAVAGVIIIAGSLLYTTVLFTDYDEIAMASTLEQWENQEMTPEQIETAKPMVEFMISPVPQAVMGFVMTLITGLVSALIIAAFVRQK